MGIVLAGAYLSFFGLLLLNDVLHLKGVARLGNAFEMWLTAPGMAYRWEAGLQAIWTLAVYAGLLLCLSLLLRAAAKALERRAARQAKTNGC